MMILIKILKLTSVVEPEPDFLAGAGAGEKGSGLLLFGLEVLWSSDNSCKI